jgi:Ca2+-transporting ATPase
VRRCPDQGWQLIGDPTEGALLALAAKAGLDAEEALEHLPRIAEIPFDSATKFMATFHHEGDQVRLCVKGAPDVLLALSSQLSDHDAALPLDDKRASASPPRTRPWPTRPARAGAGRARDPGRGLRSRRRPAVLGARAHPARPGRHHRPAAPEAREAIATCRAAGIEVKMITGDHRVTAAAIAASSASPAKRTKARTRRPDPGRNRRAGREERRVRPRRPEHKMRIVERCRPRGMSWR